MSPTGIRAGGVLRWVYVPISSAVNAAPRTAPDGVSGTPETPSRLTPSEGHAAAPADAATGPSEYDWTGWLKPPETSGGYWSFELVRHNEPSDLYWTGALERNPTVLALFDYVERCTLFRPLVTAIDPGKIGVDLPVARTRVLGETEAVLTGMWVPDPDIPLFTRLRFESDAFTIWYARRFFRTEFEPVRRAYNVQILDPKADGYELSIGALTCTTSATVSEADLSATIRSATVFSLGFAEPVSLREAAETARALDLLFGFLVGFQGKPPVFTLVSSQPYLPEEPSPLRREAKLDVAGKFWLPGPPPHPMNALHRRGLGGGDVVTVLEKFFADRDRISARIHAVDFSRHFSRSPYDRFSIVMPTLEAYLKARYTKPDEQGYLDVQDAFFAWVEKSPDPRLSDFSKKHLKVVASKAPSLPTLLERAIDFAQGKGISIPVEMAVRIAKRRGNLFHNTAKMDGTEVERFREEIVAATTLLMLHTFDDLGIDVASMHFGGRGSPEMRNYVPPPKRGVPGAPAVDTSAPSTEPSKPGAAVDLPAPEAEPPKPVPADATPPASVVAPEADEPVQASEAPQLGGEAP